MAPTSHSCSPLHFLKPQDLCFGKELPRDETGSLVVIPPVTDRADPVRNGRLPHLPQDEAGAQSREGTCPGFIGLTGNADLLGSPLDPPSSPPTRRGDSEGDARDQGC